jgi:ankyrin repeat protein
MVRFLVEYGADLIKENDKRETLLFHSCKSGNINLGRI